MIRTNVKRTGPARERPGQKLEHLLSGKNYSDREQWLEHRVEVLEMQLRETRRELNRKIQALKVFNRIVSHNLRAPLRAIHGFSTLLEKSTRQLQVTDGCYLERIRSSVARLDDILQGLLAYVHIVVGQFPMQLLDPNPLLCSTIERIHNCGTGAHATVVTTNAPLPPVWANPVLLEVVFTNLLSNALTHVTPGIPAHVIVSHERRQETIRLSIQDRGPGLCLELRQQLFGPLHPLVAFSHNGAGIGLLRVHAAAERMNARLGVESTPARGSRFWIDLAGAGPEV